MSNEAKVTLCGGTYFTLLLRARKQRMGAREHYAGKADGLSDPDVLLALAKIVAPDWADPIPSMKSTVKSATSNFKSCKGKGGASYPFEDASLIATFDGMIKTDYQTRLDAMTRLAAEYLDVNNQTKKDEYLVKALVEVIDEDDSISDDSRFYVNADGSSLTKAELCATSHFCFQPFLLGVWHYAVVHGDNLKGKETIEAIKQDDVCFGEGHKRSVILSYWSVPDDAPDVDAEEGIPEAVDAEVVAESTRAAASSGQQVINNPVYNTININGPVGAVIQHVDKITNNYGGTRNKDEE